MRRLDEARQARLKHEQLIRDQIEEKKIIEAKKRGDDEPWWVRQDKRKQMAMESERKQVVQQPVQVQVPIVPKIDVTQSDEKFDDGYRDTSSRQPQINSQGRIVLREIETQTDFVDRIASKR